MLDFGPAGFVGCPQTSFPWKDAQRILSFWVNDYLERPHNAHEINTYWLMTLERKKNLCYGN